MISIAQLYEEATAMRDRLVAVRRDLHQHPELAFQEERTAGIVAHRLSELGYDVQAGIGKTGVVGLMRGAAQRSSTQRTLLLRFDMDALPIQEQLELPFKSIYEGKMHACGHDAHTAIGLGVAELLARHRDAWDGVVKFVFQPAEEIVGGALAMIADGVLEHPRPDHTLALHVWAEEEVGVIGVTDGPALAASSSYCIVVRGRGSHGASPHLGRDPIVAAAQIVVALQTIVARNLNPLEQGVVTVGMVHGGTAPNIIPDSVELRGTVRAFSDEVMDMLQLRIREVAAGVASALGCQADVSFSQGTPATVNDHTIAALMRQVAAELVGSARVRSDHRTMGADDCAYFLRAAPGAYMFIGAGNRSKGITEPHHSPRFQIDEDALLYGLVLMTAGALRILTDER
jgi:amidohydrolase